MKKNSSLSKREEKFSRYTTFTQQLIDTFILFSLNIGAFVVMFNKGIKEYNFDNITKMLTEKNPYTKAGVWIITSLFALRNILQIIRLYLASRNKMPADSTEVIGDL